MEQEIRVTIDKMRSHETKNLLCIKKIVSWQRGSSHNASDISQISVWNTDYTKN